MADADFVMCTGPRQAAHTIDDYLPELAVAAGRDLPMICANPDREVIRGEAREICAGAIAQRYETDFNGNVAWHGKPFRPAFDEVLRMLEEPPRARVLMVGDGIHTDIAGAAAAGLDAVLVCGGIHATALGITPGEAPEAAALDGLFLARFERLNANGAPAFALVVSACLASALIVMNYTKGLVAAFELLILLSTLTTLVPYAASAASDLVLQRREGTIRWQGVAVAVGAFLFSLFAIIGSGIEVAVYGTILLAAGLPVYFWVTRTARVDDLAE